MALIAQDAPARDGRSTVSTASERDIHYWCNRLRVSRVMLARIVSEVGPRVEAVERYLRDWDE